MSKKLEHILGEEDYRFLLQIKNCGIIDNIPYVELYNGDKIFGKREKFNDKYTRIFNEFKDELTASGLAQFFYSTFYDALNFYYYENCKIKIKRTDLLKKADIFLDIGCRSGCFAIKASRAVGCNGKVYCIDATHFAETAVKRHITHNKLKNVFFIKALIGDEIKEKINFYEGSDNETYSGIFETTFDLDGQKVVNKEHHDTIIELPMYTIDYIVDTKKIKKVDMISLQINGAEPLALRGARNILREFKPIIYATTFQSSTSEYDIKEDMRLFLKDFGYKCLIEVKKEMIFV